MLDGIRVCALGSRAAVKLCGQLLLKAGATVDYVDSQNVAQMQGALLAQEFEVILVSSDMAAASCQSAISSLKAAGNAIVCDITATSQQSSRLANQWSDAQIQAITGLMDTTGFAANEPVKIGIPFTEISAAMYAAASVAAAVRVKRLRGISQNIDVSLYGCAVSALTTFLPKAFDNADVGRVGNRHPACAPWNAYKTKDGWVLICTSTDEQWRKIKIAASRPELDDPRFDLLASRVQNVDILDDILELWTSTMTTVDCSALCEEIGIAAGPIVPVVGLVDEPNFRMRHPAAVAAMQGSTISPDTYLAVDPFRITPLSANTEAHCVATTSGTERTSGNTPEPVVHIQERDAPLAGIKVVEIGQYTTAPLVGKHLAALGAQVIKIEPPEGEVARGWLPGQNGLSYFFALNNTDKQTISLDLKKDADRTHLRQLLADADVLLENLRPGALAKLGFGRETLAQINEKLIYCSISGFGIASAYPTRPAFDTVIQAMGGLMDLTRSYDTPVKVGASAADILGGQSALVALVAALSACNRDTGRFIEISMQDVTAWCALFAAGNAVPEGISVPCLDGYVWIESDKRYDIESLKHAVQEINFAKNTRARVCSDLRKQGLRATEIARVGELIEDGDFLADALSVGRDSKGDYWPILKVPYRLAHTPARVQSVPGAPETINLI